MRMLIFSVGYAAESGAETNADAMLRSFARIFEPGIVKREFRGSDGKLCVTIESLESMWREKIFGNPIADFAAAMRIERARIEK